MSVPSHKGFFLSVFSCGCVYPCHKGFFMSVHSYTCMQYYRGPWMWMGVLQLTTASPSVDEGCSWPPKRLNKCYFWLVCNEWYNIVCLTRFHSFPTLYNYIYIIILYVYVHIAQNSVMCANTHTHHARVQGVSWPQGLPLALIASIPPNLPYSHYAHTEGNLTTWDCSPHRRSHHFTGQQEQWLHTYRRVKGCWEKPKPRPKP